MTNREAMEKFKELLSVPDEMIIKYKNVCTEEQIEKLKEVKEAENMAINALSNMDKMRKQVEALKQSDQGKEYTANDIVHWAEQFLK